MDDGVHIGPRLIDLSVDPPFVIQFLPGVRDRVVFEVVLDNVVGSNQCRSKRARHQIAIGVAGISHAAMSKGIENAFQGENPIGDNNVQQRGLVRSVSFHCLISYLLSITLRAAHLDSNEFCCNQQ